MKRLGKHVAALVLAAGFSGRMGLPKAFLPYDPNRTFLEKIISEFLEFGCSSVAVVLNEEGMKRYEKMQLQHKENITAILNPAPEKERFFSVQTGLKALNFKGPVFLHNVDNPLLTQDVLRALSTAFKESAGLAQSLSRDIGASAWAPTAPIYMTPTYRNEGGHPVLLSQEIVKALIKTPDCEQNLRAFLQQFDRIPVPVDEPNVLVNINAATEYESHFGHRLK